MGRKNSRSTFSKSQDPEALSDITDLLEVRISGKMKGRTIAELCEVTRLGETTVRSRIRKLLRDGKVKVCEGRGLSMIGKPCVEYRYYKV